MKKNEYRGQKIIIDNSLVLIKQSTVQLSVASFETVNLISTVFTILSQSNSNLFSTSGHFELMFLM